MCHNGHYVKMAYPYNRHIGFYVNALYMKLSKYDKVGNDRIQSIYMESDMLL